MPNKLTLKVIVILGIVVLFGSSLKATYDFYYGMTKEERKTLRIENNLEYKKKSKEAIKLGLDLLGGMHVILEVDNAALFKALANKIKREDKLLDEALKTALAEASGDGDIVASLETALEEAGSSITEYYSNRDNRSRDDVVAYLRKQQEETIDRALEVLRNRVDQFGVSEPLIQKQGDNRIVVELAGIDDQQAARDILGKTALLEFVLLRESDVTFRVLQRINDYLDLRETASTDSGAIADAGSEPAASDSGFSSVEDFMNQSSSDDSTAADTSSLTENMLGSGKEPLFLQGAGGRPVIREQNVEKFHDILNDPNVQAIIDQEVGQGRARLLVENSGEQENLFESNQGPKELEVFLLNKEPELTGSTIVDAAPSTAGYSGGELNTGGMFETSLTFNSEGMRKFSSVTGANIQKRMAIVLDGRVRSAPVIQNKIRNGRARITGLDSFDEAKMLSSVLKAGSLPAPLSIIGERTVGATLGEDSVRNGSSAAIYGLLLVAVFMMIYYKTSGVIADIALALNVMLIMGTMALLHATLTLPGIAGIILTIGMAVDANVLIFERIREEVDRGKSTWAALDTGYSRAFITILDANVTTFIAGVVLYNFGTGPIKGFATTLMVGIIASMFTAIFVTRTIYELLLSRKIIKKLSI